MDLIKTASEQWPLLLIAAWFGYKWWNARRVQGLLPGLLQRGAVLVDVRSSQEFASGQAPNTINIPLQELGSRLQEIPRGVPVVVCCASGTRSGMAKLVLQKNGFREVHNAGAWTKLVIKP